MLSSEDSIGSWKQTLFTLLASEDSIGSWKQASFYMLFSDDQNKHILRCYPVKTALVHGRKHCFTLPSSEDSIGPWQASFNMVFSDDQNNTFYNAIFWRQHWFVEGSIVLHCYKKKTALVHGSKSFKDSIGSWKQTSFYFAHFRRQHWFMEEASIV